MGNYVNNQTNEPTKYEEERKVCSHDEYIDLVLRNSHVGAQQN